MIFCLFTVCWAGRFGWYSSRGNLFTENQNEENEKKNEKNKKNSIIDCSNESRCLHSCFLFISIVSFSVFLFYFKFFPFVRIPDYFQSWLFVVCVCVYVKCIGDASILNENNDWIECAKRELWIILNSRSNNDEISSNIQLADMRLCLRVYV